MAGRDFKNPNPNPNPKGFYVCLIRSQSGKSADERQRIAGCGGPGDEHENFTEKPKNFPVRRGGQSIGVRAAAPHPVPQNVKRSGNREYGPQPAGEAIHLPVFFCCVGKSIS